MTIRLCFDEHRSPLAKLKTSILIRRSNDFLSRPSPRPLALYGAGTDTGTVFPLWGRAGSACLEVAAGSADLCYIDSPFNSKRNYNQIYNNTGDRDAQ